MSEYILIDDILSDIYDNCICQLTVMSNKESDKHNKVLKDAIMAKMKDVLVIVYKLMVERDDLVERIRSIQKLTKIR